MGRLILANFWFHSWFPVASMCELVMSWTNRQFLEKGQTDRAEPLAYQSQPLVTVHCKELLLREGALKLQGEWVGINTVFCPK